MSGSHDHGHDLKDRQRGALIVSIVLNTVLLGAQVLVGLAIGSLALLADSLHNASDVVALIVALVGQLLIARPSTARRSYGFARAEILAALLNSAVLIALTFWVVVEAIGRFSEPEDIDPGPLAIIGVIAIAVNGGSAWYLARSGGKSLNMRAAFWHLVGDALGSLGVVIAAVALAVWDAEWADPLASIVISLLILVGVFGVLRDTVVVLLEATPPGIDPDEVTTALTEMEGVNSVHHLHIWSIDSQTTALTAHLDLVDGMDLHTAQEIADGGRTMLHDRFEIAHATFEPECHECAMPAHDHDDTSVPDDDDLHDDPVGPAHR